MIKSRTNGNRISKRLLITAALLVLAAVGISYYMLKANSQPIEVNTAQTQKKEDESFINLDPPTEEEKQQTSAHKENLATATPPPTSSGGKLAVTPTITSATVEGVRSFVSGVVEDEGICTATFTKGASVFTKTSKGFADASNTVCTFIELQRSDFSGTGTWSVVMSYESSKASGKSQATSFEVK